MKSLPHFISVGVFNNKKSRYLHKFKCLKCKHVISTFLMERTTPITKLCKQCFTLHIQKPVSLRYYNSSKVWNYPSITAFCKPRKHVLGKFAKYHFTDVLNGKRLHYKGWLRADNKIKIDVSKVIKITHLCVKDAAT